MRKTIFIPIVILYMFIVGYNVQAQEKFTFGVQTGLGAASAYSYHTGGNEYTSDLELGIPKNYPIFSYMYGLYFSYKINKDWGIAFEPAMVRKGYGNKVVEENDVAFHKRYANYLQMPVLMEFHIDEELPIVLTIGPEFGYLLNAKMRTSYDSSKASVSRDLPKNNRFDFGLQIGGYYSLTKHIDVGLKVGGSLTRVEKLYLTDNVGNVLTEVSRQNVYANSFIRVKL